MNCDNAQPLIPRYQDGELEEELAAPLRQHLLGCGACREDAKRETTLKRWFAAPAAMTAPPGFAAHVARRAFAGDGGFDPLPEVELQPARDQARTDRPETPILPFVLRMTAAAAAILFVLAIGLRWRSLPDTGALDAESLTEVMEVIEALNEAEAINDPKAPTGATGPGAEAPELEGQ